MLMLVSKNVVAIVTENIIAVISKYIITVCNKSIIAGFNYIKNYCFCLIYYCNFNKNLNGINKILLTITFHGFMDI